MLFSIQTKRGASFRPQGGIQCVGLKKPRYHPPATKKNTTKPSTHASSRPQGGIQSFGVSWSPVNSSRLWALVDEPWRISHWNRVSILKEMDYELWQTRIQAQPGSLTFVRDDSLARVWVLKVRGLRLVSGFFGHKGLDSSLRSEWRVGTGFGCVFPRGWKMVTRLGLTPRNWIPPCGRNDAWVAGRGTKGTGLADRDVVLFLPPGHLAISKCIPGLFKPTCTQTQKNTAYFQHTVPYTVMRIISKG